MTYRENQNPLPRFAFHRRWARVALSLLGLVGSFVTGYCTQSVRVMIAHAEARDAILDRDQAIAARDESMARDRARCVESSYSMGGWGYNRVDCPHGHLEVVMHEDRSISICHCPNQ